MTIYIARNGEKLGPYSLADVQNLLRSGSILATDLAWYEGLTTWIPVNQVPGLQTTILPSAPSPQYTAIPAAAAPGASVSNERPVLVWVICIFFFVCAPFGLIGLAITPVIDNATMASGNDLQREMAASRGLWSYYVPTFANLILVVVWAIQLFRLKRSSVYIYAVVLALSFIMTIIKVVTMESMEAFNSQPLFAIGLWVGLSIAWVINLALLYYNLYLFRKGTLR